jgi:hypothetical protein
MNHKVFVEQYERRLPPKIPDDVPPPMIRPFVQPNTSTGRSEDVPPPIHRPHPKTDAYKEIQKTYRAQEEAKIVNWWLDQVAALEKKEPIYDDYPADWYFWSELLIPVSEELQSKIKAGETMRPIQLSEHAKEYIPKNMKRLFIKHPWKNEQQKLTLS